MEEGGRYWRWPSVWPSGLVGEFNTAIDKRGLPLWSDHLLWDTVFHFLINCAPIKIKGTRRVNGGRVMVATFLSVPGLLCRKKARGHLVYCFAVA